VNAINNQRLAPLVGSSTNNGVPIVGKKIQVQQQQQQQQQ